MELAPITANETPKGMSLRYGEPGNPIWLIGDSNPKDEGNLAHPLDPRHPTRHNIWTPILDVIQEKVYPRRLLAFGYGQDAGALYIQNAVIKPDERNDAVLIEDRIKSLRERYMQHAPLLVLSFGAFAFEVCRAAIEQNEATGEMVIRQARNRKVTDLAAEFNKRVNVPECSLLPLLHQSVARSFDHAHKKFSDQQHGSNYFLYAGQAIARRLLHQHSSASIWR